MKRVVSLLLVLAVTLGLAGCQPSRPSTGGSEVEYQAIDPADAISHTDRTTVYDTIGKRITIDMVQEDENGLAWVEVDGTRYTLGMDFLSFAMVYNCAVPEGSQYRTQEDVFHQWWKLYIQRWNYLVPEVPLYSNQFFDLYNAKIQNFVTTPYWGAADAIVAASVKTGNANSVILGSSTDLSGAFRNAAWGKSSPGSADQDIENLVTGFATVMTDKNGAFVWNAYALAQTPVARKNADGSLTYTIQLRQDMRFSDGSPITAHNYIASILANSTDVAAEAGGSGKAGQTLVGFAEFKAYTGGEAGNGASRYFSGIRLLDDYSFSVTYLPEYADYYYVMSYAAFTPEPLALYLGDNQILVAEDGSVGLSDGFYAKVDKNGTQGYAMADVIIGNLKWDSGLPYSGPYVVSNYNPSTLTATLTRNPQYPGDTARGTASIDTITYIKAVEQTQMDMFTTGQMDVLSGITGADATQEALALVQKSPDQYAETHYDRAGYGKLGFRADFGPTGMVEVRQAIMHTINRPAFAQTFTGGYGSVVHGPYYTGYPAYIAVQEALVLNQYAYSADAAILLLEEGGWVYNGQGQAYDPQKDAVRYKKLSGYEKSLDNLNFRSTDGRYKTVKIDGEYYMPLAVNWYGTQPNEMTDQLITAWQANPNATTAIGMYITYTTTDFNTGLYGELLRMESYGYNGTPKLNAINFATGFNSAMYDYSWNWTLDPQLQAAGYNASFLNDEADFMENYR